VRIAGVSVGKVIDKSLDPNGNGTIATVQMTNAYAPVHQDARAILREKTILGETYIELTPGSPTARAVPDGGLLSRGQVQPAVQLDQIFNAFDPQTRRAFQVWQAELAKAIHGNDQNLNDVLGNLPQFAADATDILRVLDVQHTAVVNLLQKGAIVFSALSQDQTSLRNLITSGEATFAVTAANNNAIADTFHVFPTFLNESKATMTRLKAFSLDTDPLIKQLEPVAQNLGPTLHSVRVLSPDLEHLFVNLGPLITVSQTGLPAVRDILHGAKPLLGALGPFLEQLNPIFDWIALHQQLTSDFISNGAGALAGLTQLPNANGISPTGSGLNCQGVPCGHYLRQFGPTGPETLSLAPTRDSGNRGNTYPPPLWLGLPANFTKGNFPAWDCKNTGAGGDGSITANNSPGPLGHESCWVAPTLPDASGPSKGPHVLAAKYPAS
jgi:ABC-type transporter Mla subunit MlaD